jgi:hypothetical protein
MHRIARAASVFVVSSLFIAVQPARALDIVLTNDDGFESALTYAIVPSGAPVPPGLSSLPDDDADAAQNVVNAGDIAISVIEGTHQATRDMRQRVAAGLQRLLSPGHAR